jgi:hypothetical protein
MKQTRLPVHAIKQSIYLDVYGNSQQCDSISTGFGLRKNSSSHGRSFGVVINVGGVVAVVDAVNALKSNQIESDVSRRFLNHLVTLHFV